MLHTVKTKLNKFWAGAGFPITAGLVAIGTILALTYAKVVQTGDATYAYITAVALTFLVLALWGIARSFRPLNDGRYK